MAAVSATISPVQTPRYANDNPYVEWHIAKMTSAECKLTGFHLLSIEFPGLDQQTIPLKQIRQLCEEGIDHLRFYCNQTKIDFAFAEETERNRFEGTLKASKKRNPAICPPSSPEVSEDLPITGVINIECPPRSLGPTVAITFKDIQSRDEALFTICKISKDQPVMIKIIPYSDAIQFIFENETSRDQFYDRAASQISA
jgi:hypothetical protein